MIWRSFKPVIISDANHQAVYAVIARWNTGDELVPEVLGARRDRRVHHRRSGPSRTAPAAQAWAAD